MSTVLSTSTAFYIYAFVRTTTDRGSLTGTLQGIDNSPVVLHKNADVSVAMSPVESRKIRPQRKNLAAHQEVVTTLAKSFDSIPVAFGLIADNLEQVDQLISQHRETLAQQIDRVAGRMEMAVNLRWAVENVVQHFVSRYAELSEVRDAISQGTATRDEQIAAGQHLEALITSEREQHTERFTDVLRNVCVEMDVQKPRDERDVMRLACLISRDAEARFNDAIYKAASLFSDDFAISFNGPWPPYSFVNLALSLE